VAHNPRIVHPERSRNQHVIPSETATSIVIPSEAELWRGEVEGPWFRHCLSVPPRLGDENHLESAPSAESAV